MRRRGAVQILLSLLTGMLLLLTACGGGRTAEEDALRLQPEEQANGQSRDAELRRQQRSERSLSLPLPSAPRVEALRLEVWPRPDELAVLEQISEGLCSYSAKGQLRLWQAEAVEASEDFRSWNFRLRSDLKWSDGQAVRAEDYRNSLLKRLRKSPLKSYGFLIKGARAYAEGLVGEEAVGIRAEGLQLRFELEESCPLWQEWLVHPFFYPEKLSEAMPATASSAPQATKPDQQQPLLSNAAYQLDLQSLQLRPNPHYWDAGHLGLQTINFQIYSQPVEAYEAYRSGLLDAIGEPFYPLPQERREEALRRPDLLIARPSRWGALQLQEQNPLFATSKRRQILNQVLDAPYLVEALLMDGSPVFPSRGTPSLADKQQVKEALLSSLRPEEQETLTSSPLTLYSAWPALDQRILVASSKEWLELMRLPLQFHRELQWTEAERQARTYDVGYFLLDSPTHQPSSYLLLLSMLEGEGAKAETARGLWREWQDLERQQASLKEREAFYQKLGERLPQDLGLCLLHQRYAPQLVARSLAGWTTSPKLQVWLRDCWWE